jgi:hypothetical protein
MDINNTGKIYGIPEGITYRQFERTDELNDRIVMRNIPDIYLRPNIDCRTPSKVQHDMDDNYSVKEHFVPATQRHPVSGFIDNVNRESELRNQHCIYRRGCEKNIYIPSSSSDLYKVPEPTQSEKQRQPFPRLFETATHEPNVRAQSFGEGSIIGRETFFNNTRTQLRNMI